jgi:hypothetical protein
MKCFYHSADLDGHCSGELVRRAHPDCEMIGINYGDTFPWDSIEPGETVYMVDFSLQPWLDMERLAGVCDLIWIDHHKSAIESSLEHPINYRGEAAVGLGACALVWRWLQVEQQIPFGRQHSGAMQISPPIKEIRLLAEYDVWDHHDPDCLLFQYGMRLHETAPGSPIWGVVLDRNGTQRVIDEGMTILSYQRQQDAIRARVLCFEVLLDGLRCIAANHGLGSSALFDSVWDPEKHDAMLTFAWKGRSWTISLYSTKQDVDVSVIAKARGGGGHKGAAGFQCAELPFALPAAEKGVAR